MRTLLFIAPALTVAACDSGSDSDPNPAPDSNAIGGTYVGPDTSDDGVTQTLTLAIPTTTSGTFTITSGSVAEVGPDYMNEFPITGTGTHTPPNLTLDTDSFLPLEGAVSDDGNQITLVNEDMISYTLTRQ